MNSRSCSVCLFSDVCESQVRARCSHFYPAGDEAVDDALDTFIEQERQEFREEWWRYTGDSEEEFYF